MRTEKLYDKDSYLSEFKATVVSCKKAEEKFIVVLDKTAFFPLAGGQPCDKGTINGINVVDVQIKDDIVYHYLEKELNIGETVDCKIDFKRRFSFMQNHTGEHIVSGVINKLYGFDNVGFHLNEEIVTLDFNGILDRNKLDEIENIANTKVFENNSIKTFYPTADELKCLDFRQKKEIDGDIRIVLIDNTDICACCAPHVKKTGEIGMIKLLSFEKMRGGTRIYMKCGSLALADYQNKLLNISKIQNLLSCKPEDTAEAVGALSNKLTAEKQKVSALNKKLIGYMVENSESEDNLIVVDDFDAKDLILLADSLYKKHGIIKTVLSKKTDDSYLFVTCADQDTANEFFNKIKNELKISGGGRNGMIQGTINECLENIKGVIDNL